MTTIPIRIKDNPWRDENLLYGVFKGFSFRIMAQMMHKSIGTVQQGLEILEDKGYMTHIEKKWNLTLKGIQKLESLGYDTKPNPATAS